MLPVPIYLYTWLHPHLYSIPHSSAPALPPMPDLPTPASNYPLLPPVLPTPAPVSIYPCVMSLWDPGLLPTLSLTAHDPHDPADTEAP